MYVLINGTKIPCGYEGIVTHLESKYFGWYLVTMPDEQFRAASEGKVTGVGLGLEKRDDKIRALIRPAFIEVE
jgi:hypothetical protein